MITISLAVLAAICFGLGAFNVSGLNWQNAGLCLLTVALFIKGV